MDGWDRGVPVAARGPLPDVGDTVLLGPPAGAQFRSPEFPAWFRVVAVEPGMTEGFVYLTGWTARDIVAGTAPRKEFCRAAGLVIRSQPFQLPDDPGDPRASRAADTAAPRDDHCAQQTGIR